jgi:transposase InsO family protein
LRDPPLLIVNPGRYFFLAELRAALIEFRDRYNHQWILGRLSYRTPVQARQDFLLELEVAA